jgi:hypothetical protein
VSVTGQRLKFNLAPSPRSIFAPLYRAICFTRRHEEKEEAGRTSILFSLRENVGAPVAELRATIV